MSHAWVLDEGSYWFAPMASRLVGAPERPVPALDGRVGDLFSQPFAVGYVCRQLLVSSDDFEPIKVRLREYAASHGLSFGSVYADQELGDSTGFHGLLAAIERYDVQHVLVPSMAHIRPIGRPSKKDHIEHFTRATVRTIRDP